MVCCDDVLSNLLDAGLLRWLLHGDLGQTMRSAVEHYDTAGSSRRHTKRWDVVSVAPSVDTDARSCRRHAAMALM